MANLRFFCDLLWFLIQFFRSPSVSLNLGRIDTLVFFFDLTLTILLLLGSRGDSLVSDSGARGVNLVHLRAELFIAANESDHAAEGANARALRVPLKLVAHTLGQNRHGDLILVVVFELSSNVADLSDNSKFFINGPDFAIFYTDFVIFYTDFVIFYTGFLLFCIRLLKPLDEARDEGLDIVTFINDDALDTEVGNVNVNV